MTYASIITPVADAPEVEPHLSAAVMLTRAYRATLIGSGAEYSLPPSRALGMGDPCTSGDLAVLERDLVQDDLGAAGRKFRDASKGEQARWHGSIELPLPALARRALMADLVVMGHMPADREDIVRSISVGDAVMKVGRPVLQVPGCGMTQEPRTVAIAWKDTPPARRAVADALPFLRRAETVLIYTIPEREGREAAKDSMADLTRYLASHQIKATGVCLPASHSAGRDLLLAAARSRADLIVAGAFGRNRLEEWVFGGVTQTLLKEAQVPVLFSH